MVTTEEYIKKLEGYTKDSGLEIQTRRHSGPGADLPEVQGRVAVPGHSHDP